MSCEEELKRIKQYKVIIIEDGKVNGVIEFMCILGYIFFYFSVVFCFYVQFVFLIFQDEFFILGSKGLWDSLFIEEVVEVVCNVFDVLVVVKKLCILVQSYGCYDSISVVVVQFSVIEDSFCCCEFSVGGVVLLFSFGIFFFLVNMVIKDWFLDGLGVLFFSSGMVFEISSEFFIFEMSSEVGFMVFDEFLFGVLSENSFVYFSEQCCMFYFVCLFNFFQCQLFSVMFFSVFFDNGFDSDDEEFIEGVFINGSWVEVEVDIYCSWVKEKEKQQYLFQVLVEVSDEGIVISVNEDELGLFRKVDFFVVGIIGCWRVNGFVVFQERSYNVIEVVIDVFF